LTLLDIFLLKNLVEKTINCSNGSREEDIEATYEKLMSTLDILPKMSFVFAYVHIKAIKDMVHDNVALFQEIWEQTYEKQGEASLLEIKRYLRCYENIDMGWLNIH